MVTNLELLVCVDGSHRSAKIAEYAIEFARKLSARILLIYVVYDVTMPEIQSQLAEDLGKYYKSVGKSVLAKISEDIRKSGLEFDSLIEVGHPAERIVEVARARKVEMIVLSLQGLHGLNRMRSLGSVSRRVLENAPCPVIVVHDDLS